MHDNRSKKLCSKARTTSKYCLIDLFDSITNSFFHCQPHFQQFLRYPTFSHIFLTLWVGLPIGCPWISLFHAPCAMPPCRHAMLAAAIRLSRDVDADNLAIQLAVVKGRHSFLSILWP